jgi:hypothetical protein
MAESISSTVQKRRLHVEIDMRPEERGFQAGRGYVLRLRFEPETSAPHALPAQFGMRSHLNLTLNLFGENLSVQDSALQVMLPQSGKSSEVTTRIEIREAGDCQLRIVVTTAAELEILQTYTYKFTASATEDVVETR